MTDLAIVTHVKATDARKPLTPRQSQILMFVGNFTEWKGYPPTRADIAGYFGFKSANAAEEHLQALARKGYLRLVRGTAGGIALVN